jgi:hypothetical protein
MPDTIPEGSPIDLQMRQRCIVLAALKEHVSVTNSAQYEIALGHTAEIRAQIDAIETGYQPAIDKLRKPLDGFYEDKRMLLKPLQEADKIITDAALAWKMAEEERAAAEQRRLQAEADAEAERERQAKLKAIEDEKKKAAKAGDKSTVRELEREAATVAAAPAVGRQVYVSSSVPDVEGMSAGKKWTVRDDRIDIKQLCEAVAKGWCSPLAVLPNLKFLNQQAKSHEQAFNEPDPKTKRPMYPGVTAYNAGSARRT